MERLLENLLDLFESVNEAIGTYYHISQVDFGSRVKFKPRIPQGMGLDEPKTPRTCVANSIEGCFVALAGIIAPIPVYVYKLQGNPRITGTRGVIDARVTGEKWVRDIALFKKYKTIDEQDIPENIWKKLEDLDVGSLSALPIQRELKKELKKYLSGSVMSETFEEEEDDIPLVLAPMNFDRARARKG